MINFIKKLFGYHVCGPFTQWEYKEYHYKYYLHPGIDYIYSEYTEEFQERKCAICGKIQRIEI